MKFLNKIKNKIRKLLGLELIELVWDGDLEIVEVIRKFKIDVHYTLDRPHPPEGKVEANLYIYDLGGFIPYNTKLFIYQNNIYRGNK